MWQLQLIALVQLWDQKRFEGKLDVVSVESKILGLSGGCFGQLDEQARPLGRGIHGE